MTFLVMEKKYKLKFIDFSFQQLFSKKKIHHKIEMEAQLPTFNELLKETVEGFENQYHLKPDLAACAPGRVNLIGEHIDYCDGFVLPMVSAFNSIKVSFNI